MGRMLVFLVMIGAAWMFFTDGRPGAATRAIDSVKTRLLPGTASTTIPERARPASGPAWPSAPAAAVASDGYECGGRTHCSQMRSCAEATWVLRNCPGTQMDGDRDGIPCESQFCGH